MSEPEDIARKAQPAVAHHPDLFCRMADLVGVDLDGKPADAEAEAKAILRAAERCRICVHETECAGWLDTGYGLPVVPGYCPNAPFYYLRIALRDMPE